MDKPIEKKTGLAMAFSMKALPYWFCGLMVIFILWLIFRDDSSTLRVNEDTLAISEVRASEFNDYIRISGQVHPMTTIQVSPREAGIVEEIIIEEGITTIESNVIDSFTSLETIEYNGIKEIKCETVDNDHLIGIKTLSIGSISAVIISPNILLTKIIKSNAKSFLIAHNHHVKLLQILAKVFHPLH